MDQHLSVLEGVLGDSGSHDSSVSRQGPAEMRKVLGMSAVVDLMDCQLKPQDLLRDFVMFQDHSGQG